jgi:hypothetical protein
MEGGTYPDLFGVFVAQLTGSFVIAGTHKRPYHGVVPDSSPASNRRLRWAKRASVSFRSPLSFARWLHAEMFAHAIMSGRTSIE